MFDLGALTDCVSQNGPTARIVIAAHAGSAPREAGTAMLVWATGQSGTIGGGALEWQAVCEARSLLSGGAAQVRSVPLGPALGQCCGGAVTLVTEVFGAQTLPIPRAGLIARSLDGSDMPLAVQRILDRARAQGRPAQTQKIQGWMIEPLAARARPLWIWGAGHVGRALVDVLGPLPEIQISWVDITVDRFPEPLPQNIAALPVADPLRAIALAPLDAEHLIVTFSHSLDLELCHGLLSHGFASCGLIGSATKWARFRSRLSALGHSPTAIARIQCPIGSPALGKHPQAIAIGVASHILTPRRTLLQEQRN